MKTERESAAPASAAAATYQTLAAVAARHVSFAGAVSTDLVAGSPHHDDATRVAVACCCKNKRTEGKERLQVCVAKGDRKKKQRLRFSYLSRACCQNRGFLEPFICLGAETGKRDKTFLKEWSPNRNR